MFEVETYFRYCPECGRRFHIRLTSKKEVSLRKENVEEKRAYVVPVGVRGWPQGFIPLEESVPVTIDIEDFQYSYKCKHCGHEWIENRVERKKED